MERYSRAAVERVQEVILRADPTAARSGATPHRATWQRAAPAHPLDLQTQVLKAHRVVAVHRALKLQREEFANLSTSYEILYKIFNFLLPQAFLR